MTLWLLGALGWLRKAAGAALDLARRYPLQAACIALLCLSGWLWHGKGNALAERDADLGAVDQDLRGFVRFDGGGSSARGGELRTVVKS